MESKIRIMLVDDHQIVLDGVRSLLQNETDIEVIGEASNFKDLSDHLTLVQPDIILLDISLPDVSGIEITKILNKTYPAIRIIILSMYVNEEFILNSIQSGASSYLAKNSSKAELLKAIRSVYKNGEYYNTTITSILAKSYVKNIKTEQKKQETEEILSKREIEILKLFANGYSNKEISDELSISVRTVESHKNHIMQKLDIKSKVELIKYTIKNNLTDI